MKEVYAVISTEDNELELIGSFKNFDDAARYMCEEVISHFEDAEEEINLTADEMYDNAINANGSDVDDDDLYYRIDINLHSAHAQTDINCDDYNIDVIRIPIPEGE